MADEPPKRKPRPSPATLERRLRHLEAMRHSLDAQEQQLREQAERDAERDAARAAELEQERAEHVEAAIPWLQEKWGEGHPCPHCGHKAWTVGEDLVELPLGGLDQVYAMVAVKCDNCAYTALLAASDVGVPTGDDED